MQDWTATHLSAVITRTYVSADMLAGTQDERTEIVGTVRRREGEDYEAFTQRLRGIVARLQRLTWRDSVGEEEARRITFGQPDTPVYEGTLSFETTEEFE